VYSKQSIRTAHFVNIFVAFKNVEFSVFANKKARRSEPDILIFC